MNPIDTQQPTPSSRRSFISRSAGAAAAIALPAPFVHAQPAKLKVGVMLPASVAADIVFFALHMAGKTPVMMNWTTGPSSLAHGVKVTGTQRIITSKKLVDRLGIEVPGTPYEYLETIRGGIGKAEQISTLLGTILNSGAILRGLPKQDPDEPAVFLFTSGSESAPKTVPLSHTNLITNITDSLEVLEVTAADSLLGFLPPFHSFGLTGNVLLPGK